MKIKNQHFTLFILVVALAISFVSLLAVREASASAAALPTCSGYVSTSSCKYSCVPSNPNGCGTAKWSYFCSTKQFIIFQNGKRVGSSTGAGTYCSTSPYCTSTCQ